MYIYIYIAICLYIPLIPKRSHEPDTGRSAPNLPTKLAPAKIR